MPVIVEEFLATWPLFQHAYLAGWLLAGLLAAIGVLVVARDQIFIGAAVSQASICGIAIALELGDRLGHRGLPWLRHEQVLSALAVLSSGMAALATTRWGEGRRLSHEALTGWIYLFGASAAILVVAHSPHGLEEVHRLLSSSIIGASAIDVALFAALALVTAGTLALTHRRLLLVTIDPPMAAALGLHVPRWSAAISLWLGLAVGLGIRVTGVLFTFGCLVLPPLIARNLCREARPMFVVAPGVAVLTALGGFVAAHHWDYPPAQMTVALLCGLLVASTWWPRSTE